MMDEMPAAKPGWNAVLTRTYSLYAQHFWTFLKLALLPGVIAWFYRYAYRIAFRHAVLNGWLDRSSFQNLPLMAALGLTEGSFYWITSAFFFAAVASHVLFEATENSTPLSDAFSVARSRIGAVVGVAMLASMFFYVGRTVSAIVLIEAFGRSPLMRNYWAATIIFFIPQLLIAGLLSRLGLAIPMLMAQPEVTFSHALKQSIALTEGWEPFFMMFLTKSVVVGFLGYWGANFLLGQLWLRGLLTRATYPWAQTLFYIAIAAALESPLFISFSVLFRDLQTPKETVLTAPAIA